VLRAAFHAMLKCMEWHGECGIRLMLETKDACKPDNTRSAVLSSSVFQASKIGLQVGSHGVHSAGSLICAVCHLQIAGPGHCMSNLGQGFYLVYPCIRVRVCCHSAIRITTAVCNLRHWMGTCTAPVGNHWLLVTIAMRKSQRWQWL
jgi:hypothetical protein